MLSRRPISLGPLAVLALSASAVAQSPQAPKPSDGTISAEDARRIATDNGIARIAQIEFDAGHWNVEGRDSLGSGIEMKLRASDGTILKLKRERPASARAGD